MEVLFFTNNVCSWKGERIMNLETNKIKDLERLLSLDEASAKLSLLSNYCPEVLSGIELEFIGQLKNMINNASNSERSASNLPPFLKCGVLKLASVALSSVKDDSYVKNKLLDSSVMDLKYVPEIYSAGVLDKTVILMKEWVEGDSFEQDIINYKVGEKDRIDFLRETIDRMLHKTYISYFGTICGNCSSLFMKKIVSQSKACNMTNQKYRNLLCTVGMTELLSRQFENLLQAAEMLNGEKVLIDDIETRGIMGKFIELACRDDKDKYSVKVLDRMIEMVESSDFGINKKLSKRVYNSLLKAICANRVLLVTDILLPVVFGLKMDYIAPELVKRAYAGEVMTESVNVMDILTDQKEKFGLEWIELMMRVVDALMVAREKRNYRGVVILMYLQAISCKKEDLSLFSEALYSVWLMLDLEFDNHEDLGTLRYKIGQLLD